MINLDSEYLPLVRTTTPSYPATYTNPQSRSHSSLSDRCAPPTGSFKRPSPSNSTNLSSPPLVSYERPLTPTAQLPWELPPQMRNEIAPDRPSDSSVVQRIHDTAEWIPCLTVSSFTILPSIHFQTMPQPLQGPLLFVPMEHVHVSYISRSDLDMKLYVFLDSTSSLAVETEL